MQLLIIGIAYFLHWAHKNAVAVPKKLSERKIFPMRDSVKYGTHIHKIPAPLLRLAY